MENIGFKLKFYVLYVVSKNMQSSVFLKILRGQKCKISLYLRSILA
ncbi:MAG: hypothetical protein U5L45_13605 [Saprospiraceae bacterium]|nr:hypothetical protein [Saprospiraceae bacterium]